MNSVVSTSEPITLEIINILYAAIRKEVAQVIPMEKWALRPLESVVLRDHHNSHGEVTHKGEISIYSGMVGLTAYRRLERTLRHELAHCCVGLHHCHDKVFRRVERAFGVDITEDISEDDKQIKAVIPYKWTVIAHLVNGTQVSLGGVHKKTKKWSEYSLDDKTSHRADLYQGVKVKHYEFIENK